MQHSETKWSQVVTLLGTEMPVVADIVSRWSVSDTASRRASTVRSIGNATLLVVAPHSDDAALSVGGLLHLTWKRWARHIGTLVGKSDYVLQPQAYNGVAEVSATREQEERRFAHLLDATLHYGTALDASLRYKTRGPFREPSASHVTEFEGLVELWVQRLHPRLLLAPLGIGGHADHLAAGLAACSVAHRHDADLLLYEDLPYAAVSDQTEGVASSLAKGRVRWLLPIGSAVLQKAAYLGVYASQFELSSVQRTVANHAWDGATWVERLWASTAPPIQSNTASALGLLEGCAA